MRHKIGLLSAAAARALPVADPAPVADPVPAKSDVSMAFGRIDLGAEPLSIEVVIEPHDGATTNRLLALTALVIPEGAEKPPTAEGLLASGFARIAIAAADPAPAVAPATIQPIGPIAPVPIAPIPIPADPIPVPAPADLPGPPGGTVTFLIPGVPDGRYEVQLVETYDQ